MPRPPLVADAVWTSSMPRSALGVVGLGVMGSNLIPAAILGESGVLYDIDKFIYLGTPYSGHAHIFLTRKGAGLRNLENLRAAKGVQAEEWVREEGIRAHHSLPIVQRPDGTERSMWPAKWPMTYLAETPHTRSYAKNMSNDPLAADGAQWTPDALMSPLLLQGVLMPNQTPESPNETVHDSWLMVEFVFKTQASNASPRLKSFNVAFKCSRLPG